MSRKVEVEALINKEIIIVIEYNPEQGLLSSNIRKKARIINESGQKDMIRSTDKQEDNCCC